MAAFPTQIVSDTTVVYVAGGGLAALPPWAITSLAAALGALVLVLVLVLIMVLVELRRLSRAMTTVMGSVGDRSGPLIESMNAAARNVEYVTDVVRSDVVRLNDSFGGLVDGLTAASTDVQARLLDLSALLEVAHSEAEEAVLEAATRVRVLRRGSRLLRRTQWRRPAEPPESPGIEEGEER